MEKGHKKMKSKKILALASIFAGVALVGGTFAAWAVTDNANTKNIKISGEKINPDTGTSYVTLEYGEHTSVADVANLEAGTKRYAGTVGLVATYTGAEAYNGLLGLEMSQAARAGARLIDYLKVYVYDAAPTYDSTTKVVSGTSGNLLLTLDGSAGTPVLSNTASIAMTSGTEKQVYFVVEMLSTAADATILNTIKSDIVNLAVDWNHDTTGQPVASSTTVYYKPTLSSGDKVYCYAWKDKTPNADWPGQEMTLESDGVYSYTINTTSFDKFILCYGQDDTYTKARETDFAITEVVGANNYWNGTTWTTRPAADPTLTADYYIVGDMAASDWGCNATYAMTEMTEGADHTDDAGNNKYMATGVVFAAGQKIKIRNNSNRANEEWYSNVGTWEGCGFTLDLDGNVVVTAAGTYTVYLLRTSNYNNNILLTKTA